MKNEKPELSKKNPYYLPKHRYYELKHLCLQYHDWKRALARLNGWKSGSELGENRRGNQTSDPTGECAVKRAYYAEKIDMIERCLEKTDPVIAPYILKGVTDGLSYDKLRARGCPCCREVYYEYYRYFFWLLSKERG